MSQEQKRFVFKFGHDNTDDIIEYVFFVTPFEDRAKEMVSEIEAGESDIFDEFTNTIELVFGVHDVDMGDGDIVGWISYEVQPPDCALLVAVWHKFFRTNGFCVSDITTRII